MGLFQLNSLVFSEAAQHVLDKLVKLQTQVARDAETHDSNFSSYCWDITDQETREVLGSITSGVVGW